MSMHLSEVHIQSLAVSPFVASPPLCFDSNGNYGLLAADIRNVYKHLLCSVDVALTVHALSKRTVGHLRSNCLHVHLVHQRFNFYILHIATYLLCIGLNTLVCVRVNRRNNCAYVKFGQGKGQRKRMHWRMWETQILDETVVNRCVNKPQKRLQHRVKTTSQRSSRRNSIVSANVTSMALVHNVSGSLLTFMLFSDSFGRRHGNRHRWRIRTLPIHPSVRVFSFLFAALNMSKQTFTLHFNAVCFVFYLFWKCNDHLLNIFIGISMEWRSRIWIDCQFFKCFVVLILLCLRKQHPKRCARQFTLCFDAVGGGGV